MNSPTPDTPNQDSGSTIAGSLSTELDVLRRAGLYRSLRPLELRTGAEVVDQGRVLIDFASNDYLGLATDPRVAAAVVSALQGVSTGSGASRSIVGNYCSHEQLESELARMKGTESALLFTSGMMANLGAIPVLADRQDAIYSDALNHASILDGCRLSRAKTQTFPHLDIAALESHLRDDVGKYRRQIIVVEGVYSMDGDLFPLDRLVDIARRYGAWIYLDDAHGTGVLGDSGAGTAEHFGVSTQIDVTMATLGKALGVHGAYVAGPTVLRELLINRARTFMFTTGAPPALAAGASAALKIALSEDSLRGRLWANVRQLREGLGLLGVTVSTTGPGHILPVVLGDAARTVQVGQRLRQQGFVVGVVRPPTVPAGGSRLRITVSAAHTPAHIESFLGALDACGIVPR